MGFTVTRQGDTKDAEFQTYARLLRQKGVDLGKLSRVRDPITDQRWLFVWNTQGEAQAFADELKEQTSDQAWEVVDVNGPSSEGPRGPLMIQLVRQVDGLTFELHPLSRAMIRSAFPRAVSATTYATIDTRNWNDFKKSKGGVGELAREIAPSLTSLSSSQLDEVGYSVVDADSDETAELGQVHLTAEDFLLYLGVRSRNQGQQGRINVTTTVRPAGILREQFPRGEGPIRRSPIGLGETGDARVRRERSFPSPVSELWLRALLGRSRAVGEGDWLADQTIPQRSYGGFHRQVQTGKTCVFRRRAADGPGAGGTLRAGHGRDVRSRGHAGV